jgi:hypothetical protein
MTNEHLIGNQVLEYIADLLDIPPSHYELAIKRYKSLGEWLHRPESCVAEYDPEVFAQGSFRYGTVIRPLLGGEEYDLDLVSQLTLSKEYVSQARLKELVGVEIKGYASAHNMNEPAREGNRCWRLDYADDVSFHMDILPAVPDDDAFKHKLVALGIPWDYARHAIAVTDRRHPGYEQIQPDWLRSNPRGYAGWFEGRMADVASQRVEHLVQAGMYASVDDVPVFAWKTPLQRSIQVLKRHRDVMFRNARSLRPISMIITTLSAHAYQGEPNLWDALLGILDRMPGFVRDQAPRVPNPVNPAEDFAEKWAEDQRLEDSFWQWHAQARVDLRRIVMAHTANQLEQAMQAAYSIKPGSEFLRDIFPADRLPAKPAAVSAPAVIKAPPRPWGIGD